MTTLIRKAADPDFTQVYRAIEEWKRLSLVDGRSLFEPEQMVWTSTTIDDLEGRIFGEFDKSERTFVEKLEDELRGSSQASHLLMAEMMFIHLLPLSNVSGEKKRSHVDSIGSWAPAPFTLPQRFEQTLDLGIFNGGVGFNTGRHAHMRFLFRFARRWTGLDASHQLELLESPWAFKEFLTAQPIDGATSQLNALLMMLFPHTFESTASREHKRRIIEAYSPLAGEATDIDRQLLAIRAAKADEFGADFSWYEPAVRRTWDPEAAMASPSNRPSTVDAALRAALPDAADRKAFAEAAAAVITTASEVNDTSWSVSFRNQGIHINVGPNRTLSISGDNVGLAAAAEDRTTLIDELAGNHLDQVVVDDQPYAHPGQVFYLRAPCNSLTPLLAAAEERLLEATAKTAVWSTPHRRTHSPEALALLAELSGTLLPEPPPLAAPATTERRAWIVRMKRDGRSAVAEGLDEGVTKVWWPIDVPAGAELTAVREAMQASDPEQTAHAISNQAGNLHRFITKIRPGDVLLMPDGDDLYLGTVTGDAKYDGGVPEWSRPVDWLDTPLSRDEVSAALHSRLRSLLTVTEITPLLSELNRYLIDGDAPSAATTSQEATLAPVDDDFAKKLLLDRDWLEDIVDLLRRKKQVIFYGPPGTSKTFVATRLADHLATEGNYQLVQFHPSYSYEDFVEGFRPKLNGDALTYELTPGPLKRIAETARENPTRPYLLIIDEINRGNLAKIFGELYFLLEYREESLSLQYSGTDDTFSLPRNLYVIGTMNTADRSIALVDAAIRRRFHFVEFSPNRPPIDRLLRMWLELEQLPAEPADLLTELNRRLDDDDYAIGPSYLMDPRVATERGLEQIWNHGILPLLEEHFYGRPDAIGRFRLDSLRSALSGSNSPTPTSATDGDDQAVPDPPEQAPDPT